MSTFRKLSFTALVLGFGHIVFGAIVRISGSGLGCGDHWPKCHGYWFPPLNRTDLVIEVSHRYFAAALSATIVALTVLALLRRRDRGVAGPDGVLRPALLSFALVIAAALFGGATVKLELTNPYVTVVHLALAIGLLASLLAVVIRTGGLGGAAIGAGAASDRTARGAMIAAALTFVALALGGLTANVPGANAVCTGFPWCRNDVPWASGALHMQLAHRLVAFLLAGHVIGLLIGTSRRNEAPLIRRLARLTFATVMLQILVAAALVELQLPPVLRSLHQAVGTLLWVIVVTFAMLSRRAALAADANTMDASEGSRFSVTGARA